MKIKEKQKEKEKTNENNKTFLHMFRDYLRLENGH